MRPARESLEISVFNLFSIGIGPSSSHTVGPMRAAKQFVSLLDQNNILNETFQVIVDLYGSLALTGKGHATDVAILLGLEGYTPEGVDPDKIPEIISNQRRAKEVVILQKHSVAFNESQHLLFHRDKQLPFHPNGMRFSAFNASGKTLLTSVYYSVGGGFIVDHESIKKKEPVLSSTPSIPYPFANAKELLRLCREHHLTIPELMMENEKYRQPEDVVRQGLLNIWRVMKECVERGCKATGILPGGLNVRRRARELVESLISREKSGQTGPAEFMEWVSAWALAVNEENAAGGRVVTAPTNGAAGVIPAVMLYYERMHKNSNEEGIISFMLTAGALGILFKTGASISAAEMGCMGEVGVACAMAAGGLTAALGGTNAQIENAAEIGMEHNLGLVCDPVKALVQIPCIERNTMGAIKAINASLLALQGDGTHIVSLDQVIATMRQIGQDMKSIYKETSMGGLAVNVPEC